jgi:hypothetical protein
VSSGDSIIYGAMAAIVIVSVGAVLWIFGTSVIVAPCRKTQLGYNCQHRPGECGNPEDECVTKPVDDDNDWCVTHGQMAHRCHYLVTQADKAIAEFDRITGGQNDRRKQR